MHDASLLSSLMHFGAGCVSFFVSRCMSGNGGEVELVRSLYMFDLTVEGQKSSPKSKNIYLHLHQPVFQTSHLHRMSYQDLSTEAGNLRSPQVEDSWPSSTPSTLSTSGCGTRLGRRR